MSFFNMRSAILSLAFNRLILVLYVKSKTAKMECRWKQIVTRGWRGEGGMHQGGMPPQEKVCFFKTSRIYNKAKSCVEKILRGGGGGALPAHASDGLVHKLF